MKALKFSIILIFSTLIGCSGGYELTFNVFATDEEAPDQFIDDLVDPNNPNDPVDPNEPVDPTIGIVGVGGFGEQVPDAPTNLVVEDTGLNSVDLSWDDVLYESGYRLYRKVGTGSYSLRTIKDTPNLTTHTDGGLSQGVNVCYKVSAYNVSGESDMSDEACTTTDTCTNSAGPAVVFRTAASQNEFPSVNWVNSAGDLWFSKNSHVLVRYTLSADDQCENTFDLTIKVFPHGSTTPICTLTDTRGVGNGHKYCLLPREPVPGSGLASAVGFYDAEITASDGVASHTVTVSNENYFQIQALPDAEEELPQLVDLTASKTLVCPWEEYTVSAEFSENTIPPLDNGWLLTRLYEDGSLRRTRLYSSINRDFETEADITSNVSHVYTVNAFDLYLNLAEPTESVTVTTRPDSDAPTLTATFPTAADNELRQWEHYAISAEGSDDCPEENLQYKFLFRNGSTDHVLRGFTFSENFTFTPNGYVPAIGTTGHLVIVARDVADHEAEIVSPTQYTIAISHDPYLAISTTPESGFSTGDSITIHLTAVDNDLTGATLESLTYNHEGSGANPITIPNPSLATGSVDVTWDIPAFPGSYVLTAQMKDAEDHVVNASKSLGVNGNNVSYQVMFLDIDLDGSMSFSETVQFDVDADGVDEWTSWLNADDGYLTLDRDGNGAIDDINDFVFLQELLDGAGDVLDASDPLYNTLRIWKDANSNATSTASELTTLQSNGITKITLEPCCEFEKE